jgi:hypothetical protein
LWTRRRLTTSTTPPRPARWARGSETAPPISISPSAVISISWPAASAPSTPRSASRRIPPGVRSALRPSRRQLKATSGRHRARSATARTQAAPSPRRVRRNRSRAGVAAKRSRTSTVVPGAWAVGPCSRVCEPRTRSRAPASASRWREASTTSATAAMLASASPRKPRLPTRSRSPTPPIFEVAWRATARGSSAAAMPSPSSLTRIRTSPPSSTSTSIRAAPASTAFSQSSFTTDAGRSTTSPAAMASATAGLSSRMGLMSPAPRRPPAPATRRACSAPPAG